jgi:FAD/FMN-containing dehydrogenase
MTTMRAVRDTWRNWAANQSCSPASLVRARDVEDVQRAVREAAGRGLPVRVVGAGHSFTPLACTDGVMIDVSALSGIVGCDGDRARVTVRAGTTIAALGGPLWDHGLALANQGDIDAQTIAGAVSTATHGSGLRHTSFSGAVRSVQMVTADGEVVRIGEDDPRLAAAQTSMGSLGVLTEIELQVAPAYRLAERIEYWPYAEVEAQWAEATRGYRHFSFFWGPGEGSLELYGFPPAPSGVADACYVKIYDELPAGRWAAAEATSGRVDRSYRVYPSDFDLAFHELEYFVPYDAGLAAAAAVRQVMGRHPEQRFPMEVRTIARESGLLSPQFGRDSVSISVSGVPGTDYWPFLRAVDTALREFVARPHWGKLHLLDRSRLREVYPAFDEFVAVRRRLDPDGRFLNDHLGALIG